MKEVKKSLEEQNGKIAPTLDEQQKTAHQPAPEGGSYLWVYFISAVLALLAGFLAAYVYTNSKKKKPKSRMERIKDKLLGGLGR
jgi:flagellar basal body-associated protein FliL